MRTKTISLILAASFIMAACGAKKIKPARIDTLTAQWRLAIKTGTTAYMESVRNSSIASPMFWTDPKRADSFLIAGRKWKAIGDSCVKAVDSLEVLLNRQRAINYTSLPSSSN